MRDHPLASQKLKNGIVMNVIAGILPVNGAPERTATEDSLVVGDAAGQIIATNGGGIPPAMIAEGGWRNCSRIYYRQMPT